MKTNEITTGPIRRRCGRTWIQYYNMVFIVCLMAWSAIYCGPVDGVDTFPANEYEYSLRRDTLLEAERRFQGNLGELSDDEAIVDHYLQYLKWREFQATMANGFPPSIPSQDVLQQIQTTEIYQSLKRLPKGGNMHSHEHNEVSRRTMLDIVWDSSDFKYLYILPADHPKTPWTIDFFINPPADTPAWVRVCDDNVTYSKEEVLRHQTLIEMMTTNATSRPTDSGERWRQSNPLFNRGSSEIVANMKIKSRYLQAMYRHGLDEGVIYIETRKGTGQSASLYELDPAPEYAVTNGKRYLGGNFYNDFEVNTTLQIIANFTAAHPEFVGHRRILHSQRQQTKERIRLEIENIIRLHNKYPQHIVGYDLVGEEDVGNSLLYYLDVLLSLYDGSEKSKIPLYLHSVETSWPYDLITSTNNADPVATLENSYESLLLGARRVGHAIGLAKQPYLRELYRARGIAIEACVISNQLLGYVPDVRNHPAIGYHRSGLAVVLGADDPGVFGYDNFTVDWYSAYMAWGLGLADLKTFAINSLNYSAMTQTERNNAITAHWRPMWDSYIASEKTKACTRNYTTEMTREGRRPTFARILPRQGAISDTTKVHVFGRNFEPAICRTPHCRFGDVDSPAIYHSNTHLVCKAPSISIGTATRMGQTYPTYDVTGSSLGARSTVKQAVSVQVYVALDGEQYLPTGENFTYTYELQQMTSSALMTTAAQTTSRATTHCEHQDILFALLVCVSILSF